MDFAPVPWLSFPSPRPPRPLPAGRVTRLPDALCGPAIASQTPAWLVAGPPGSITTSECFRGCRLSHHETEW